MTSSSADYLSTLHILVNDHFNLAEIRTLCLNLNVDYESVAGEEKPSRIRELLLSLARRDRLSDLLTYLEQERPRTEWPPIPDNFQLPQSLLNEAFKEVAEYHYYGDVIHGDKVGRDKNIVGDITGKSVVAVGEGAQATAIYHGLSIKEVANLVVELKHKDQPVVWDGRTPYLGLMAFRESDAQYFFGREKLVDGLLERIQKARLIAIAGPSGSGKSSVARAGLLHALRNGQIDRSEGWLIGTMQPKSNPIEQLSDAISRLAKSPAAGDYVRQEAGTNPLALHRQVDSLLTDDPSQRAILLVDQFEEVFTQTRDEATRTAFIKLLTVAATAEKGRTIIVISLRSDFISQCSHYPELRELMSQQFQLVGAMEPKELAKAISLPALEVGATIEPALVSRILTDMKGEPGALPLMSFALRDLFEAGKPSIGEKIELSLTTYLNRGGIEGALEQHANNVFSTFSTEEKLLTKGIFSKLIQIGQGQADTRRIATFSELVSSDSNEKVIANIIDKLSQEGVRLLITDRKDGNENELQTGKSETTITIAHEKLIDAWPWLRQLVDENRESIRLQNEIFSAAQEWESFSRDVGSLYRGGKLQQAVEWLEINQNRANDLVAQFVNASRYETEKAEKEREAQRQRELMMVTDLATSQTKAAQRLRWAVLSLAGVFAASLIIIGILITPSIQERWARAEANTEMVLIPSGNFLFGKQEPTLIRMGSVEVPTWAEKEVSVPEFWMDKYEVTNRQYYLCVRYSDECTAPIENVDWLTDPDRQDHPVVNVTILQANTYCRWLGKRLPTEVEWERAARGLNGTWPWGNIAPKLEQVNMPLDVDPNPQGNTESVTGRGNGASNEGVYHLVGNVWEWTSSYWQIDKDFFDTTANWNGEIASYRTDQDFVIKGGGWNYGIPHIALGFPTQGAAQDAEIGIRCVTDASP